MLRRARGRPLKPAGGATRGFSSPQLSITMLMRRLERDLICDQERCLCSPKVSNLKMLGR